MAVETITLGTLSQQVLYVLVNDPSTTLDTTLTAQVRWALHCALRDYVSITEHQSFRTDATLVTANGTAEYALADDFLVMLEPGPNFAASDYRTLQYLTEQDFRAFELAKSQATGDPTHYMIRNRSSSTGAATIKLWPTPDSTRTINYHYLAIPAKLYDGTDATVIDKRLPANQHHVLVWGAVSYMPRFLNSNGDLTFYIQKWNEALSIGRSKSPQVVGQVYQKMPYLGSNPYRPSIPSITQASQ